MPLKDSDPLPIPITEFRVGAADAEKVVHKLEESELYTSVKVRIAETRQDVPATVYITGVPNDNAILGARRHPPQNG